MHKSLVTALLLINALAFTWSAVVQPEMQETDVPKNNAQSNAEAVTEKEILPVGKSGASSKQKGETGNFGEMVNNLLSDSPHNDLKEMVVHLCDGDKCRTLHLQDMYKEDIKMAATLTPVRGSEMMSEKAFEPALDLADRALSALESQKNLIESLEKETQALNALSASLSKGTSQPQSVTQTGSTNQKPASYLLAQAFGQKGNYLFDQISPLPLSKGGNNVMFAEAAVCPMLRFELSNTQSQLGETKVRVESLTSLLAAVQSHKGQLEAALKISESIREAVKGQALAAAKEAADEKGKNSLLEVALEKALAEKKALSEQKADLETQLADTQKDLLQERQEKAVIADALSKETKEKQKCNEDLFSTQTELRSTQNQLKVTNTMLRQSQDQLAAKTQDLIQERAEHQATEEKLNAAQQELQQTQESLRERERQLGEEQIAHGKVQRQLEETQSELTATEDARKKLEEKKQELEDELASTNANLQQVTAELDQVKVQLNETTTVLANTNAQLDQCTANFAQEKSQKESLSQQLSYTTAQYYLEKKAREEQAYVVGKVREATLKVQDEVQKLQLENLQLQTEAQKLKYEQRTALALVSGCPPSYEKFGSSCYKYVREKVQWKNAQEQCIQDGANLASVDSRDEQAFLVAYLQRQAASVFDQTALVGGRKIYNSWKWIATGMDIGASGPTYWSSEYNKIKPGYDCVGLSLLDQDNVGKWVAQPCGTESASVCEFNLAPASFGSKGGFESNRVTSSRDAAALSQAFRGLPSYLDNSKGTSALSMLALANAEYSKGAYFG